MPYNHEQFLKVAFNQPQTWRILGRRFGHLREAKGFSLRGISRSVNLSPSLVSAIENGKSTPHTDTLAALYEAIKHPLTLDHTWLSDATIRLNQYIRALYDENDEQIKQSREAIKPLEARLVDSPLYVDYVIFCGIVDVVDHRKDLSSEFHSLYDYFEDLSSDQRDLLNATVGYDAFQKGNYVLAESRFESVLNHHVNSLMDSLAHSHLAMIKAKRFNYYRALKHAKEASRFHAQNNNLKRKIDMDFLQLKLLIELRQLQEAMSLYENLSYLLVHYLQDYQERLNFYRIYLAYVNENFKEAFDLIHQTEAATKDIRMTFLKAHLLNLTGNKKEAIELLKQALNVRRVKTDFVLAMTFYYQSLTRTYDHQMVEPFIHELLKNPERFEYLDFIQFLFSLALDYTHLNDRMNLMKAISLKIIDFSMIR